MAKRISWFGISKNEEEIQGVCVLILSGQSAIKAVTIKHIMNYEQCILKYSRGERAAGVLWKQDLQDCTVYELIP